LIFGVKIRPKEVHTKLKSKDSIICGGKKVLQSANETMYQ